MKELYFDYLANSRARQWQAIHYLNELAEADVVKLFWEGSPKVCKLLRLDVVEPPQNRFHGGAARQNMWHKLRKFTLIMTRELAAFSSTEEVAVTPAVAADFILHLQQLALLSARQQALLLINSSSPGPDMCVCLGRGWTRARL